MPRSKPKPSPWRDPKSPPQPTTTLLANPSIWAVPAPKGHISASFEPEASHSLSAYLAQSTKPAYIAKHVPECTTPNCPYHAYIAAFREFDATNDDYETGLQEPVARCLKIFSERTKTGVLVGVLDDLRINTEFREEMDRAVRELLSYAGVDERDNEGEEVEDADVVGMNDTATKQLPAKLNMVKDYISKLREELVWARRKERETMEMLREVEARLRWVDNERLPEEVKSLSIVPQGSAKNVLSGKGKGKGRKK